MSWRRFICCISFAGLVGLLAGCGEKAAGTAFDAEAPSQLLSSRMLAESGRFELNWDNPSRSVQLRDKSTGRVWSNIPYEYIQSGGSSANVQSTLSISVVDNTTMKSDSLRSFDEVNEKGRTVCEPIANGMRITYYFDEYQISIPVEYVLDEDALLATVCTAAIGEGEAYSLVSVSLAPFLCAVSNEAADGYLFVPAGSGALMYARENADKTRKYSAEVYGADAARLQPEELVDETAIRLPVFGASGGGHALLGIIEQGAESAMIEAEAGNSRTGYSNAFATFYVRGYDSFPTTQWMLSYQDLQRFSTQRLGTPCSVRYYPLAGEEAGYNGMAARYREYLAQSGEGGASSLKQEAYSLTILGGVQVTSLSGGIPHKVTRAMTTFQQARDMLAQIRPVLEKPGAVRLVGFGDKGIDPGKIAGGFGFIGAYGSSAQRTGLEEDCAQAGIPLFTDFDLVQYSGSGSGFSYLTGSAKTAMLHTAERYAINVPLREYNKDITCRLLKRGLLGEAVGKLIDTAGKQGISGVSLGSLGSLAYSDFTQDAYVVKGGIGTDVSGFIGRVRGAAHAVAVAEANGYAAHAADVVFDVPVKNGEYFAFDERIPFYEMVFVGAKPLYAPAVNLEAVPEKQAMLAVASGAGLGFTLIGTYDADYTENCTQKLYAAAFEDNFAAMQQMVSRLAPVYEAIAGAGIAQYELPADGVSRTVFTNGVTVYANHTGAPADSPAGRLEAYGVAVGQREG